MERLSERAAFLLLTFAVREMAASWRMATRIYIDADACPVKDEVYRVAERHRLHVYVVANNLIRVPQSEAIERVAAGPGMDAADDWIAERAGPGDIVITADVPLASRCVKGGRGGDRAKRKVVHGTVDRHDAGSAQPDGGSARDR